MSQPILAWHGNAHLKAFTIERLREHQRLDQIIQGMYSDGKGRGCHLWCLVHEDAPHRSVERLLGIEQSVGHWLEAVFEGLPGDDCAQWVIDSANAIPVGADLSCCHHHFGLWLPSSGLWTITDVNREVIETVRVLHERAVNGDMPTPDEWSSARAARASAWSSAEASAWSSAEATAWHKIAAKSLEIFAAAPLVDDALQIDSIVVDDLESRGLYTASTG